MIHIGIDPGVKTGFAVWDSEKQKFLEISTCTITEAMNRVIIHRNMALTSEKDIMLHIEDARLRKWYGNSGREKLQGAGSVKRDSKIWEDFCKENDIEYRMVAPKNNRTKVSKEYFNKITGWTKQTTDHARDAAMLVFGK